MLKQVKSLKIGDLLIKLCRGTQLDPELFQKTLPESIPIDLARFLLVSLYKQREHSANTMLMARMVGNPPDFKIRPASPVSKQ